MNKTANADKLKIRIMIIILVFSLIAMALFGAMLALDIFTTRAGRAAIAALSDVEVMPRVELSEVTASNPSTGDIDLIAAVEREPFVPFIDFDVKRETIPNIVAWIQSEGTNINYPIVQGDDNYFYLGRLPDGSIHRMGSIFLDYRNSPDFSDEKIFIYGHHMRSGDKFGSLRNYRNQSYYEEHSTMFIFTPTDNFLLVLFAGYVVDSSYEVPPMNFADEEEFYTFVSDIRRRSVFRSDTGASFGDQLVLLVTCTDGGSIDERLILVGKLVNLG